MWFICLQSNDARNVLVTLNGPACRSPPLLSGMEDPKNYHMNPILKPPLTLGYRMPVTWPFLNPMAGATANAAAGTQAALAANLMGHQPTTAPQSVPTPSHMNPAQAAAAASMMMAQRNAAAAAAQQRRRYLGNCSMARCARLIVVD